MTSIREKHRAFADAQLAAQVAVLGELDEDGYPLSVHTTSRWGIDGDGFPYFDPSGAVEGEQAEPVIGPDGALSLVPIGA